MEYPYVKCLHPHKIMNKYTNEVLVVPCGHCQACSLQKSAISTLKCKLESAVHRYTYFVTLTYSNEYIPLATIMDNGVKGKLLVDVTKDHGNILAEVDSDSDFIHDLRMKVNTNGLFPFLYKRDLQLFIKRLRKKFPNEKIRYYAVGEYGPVHFRPHYHLILWFDSEEISKNIRQAIYTSWPFGRVDSQISRKKCASYVAGYLNSSCNLPKIYQAPQTQPFSNHSWFLGAKLLQEPKETIYAKEPTEFDKRSVPLDGTLAEFSVWRSFKTYYFPRCRAYSLLDSQQRAYSYRLYEIARDWTGEISPFKQAKYIVDYVYNTHDAFLNYMVAPSVRYDKLLRYFIRYAQINPYNNNADEKNRVLRSIYVDLRVSYHFLTFVCDNQTEEERQNKQKLIENYWSKIEYNNLVSCLEMQEKLEELYGHDSDDINYDMLYYNKIDLNKLQNDVMYKRFRSTTFARYDDSVKHKKLNDLNLLFNNR